MDVIGSVTALSESTGSVAAETLLGRLAARLGMKKELVGVVLMR